MSKALSHILHEDRVFPPSNQFKNEAHLSSLKEYLRIYEDSIQSPDAFWLNQTKELSWFTPPTKACEFEWNSKERVVQHEWFADGSLNVSYNCLDRHIQKGLGSKTALIWQGETPEETCKVTFKELLEKVCQIANILKDLGVEKGDRVALYLPMIPEAIATMLACTRIGAIHSIIFAGFSAESLQDRINDSSCKVLVTADETRRSGKKIALKNISDKALENAPSIQHCLVLRHGNDKTPMQQGRDLWLDEVLSNASKECIPQVMGAEDPLFILYTSGSTGKPKGVVHTTGGYLLHTHLTFKYLFDIKAHDIFWCSADIGWITGHSYLTYGPLSNACTSLVFEGVPTYPDPGQFWRIIEQHKVSLFYTAPTAIRALISHGVEWTTKFDLSSLRLLGTVGEPINPEAWMWYYKHIGKQNCPIIDTWWQTETGGIMLSAFPGCHTLKPGSACMPFFGVDPVILKQDGSECLVNEGGELCIRRPWPGMMRTTWGNHERFKDTYFTQHENMYFTGDGCYKDEDGYFWLLGRIDDIVNISGHRIGTAEVESALVSHALVAEAAVVPIDHNVKGQALYAFVTLLSDVESDANTLASLKVHVKEKIGGIAVPDVIQIAPALPKTRSGKIMRRILRKVAALDDCLGDVSTLADPSVVATLVENRQAL